MPLRRIKDLIETIGQSADERVSLGQLIEFVDEIGLSPDDETLIKHLRDALGEAGCLSVYAVCSIAGNWLQPGHHEEGDRRSVVLVPGFLGRGLNLFRLKHALVERGHPVYVADLGYGVGCIREKAELLEEFLRGHDLNNFYAVGHSMGGIISLAMSDRARRKVDHFITLGTAFHGAILSHLVPVFPAARQMTPDSEVLGRVLERARAHDNVTNIVAEWDEIALPPGSCRVEQCEQIEGVAGHVQLIMRSSSYRQLYEVLEELETSG